MKTCWMMLDDAGCDMILTCIATVRFDARWQIRSWFQLVAAFQTRLPDNFAVMWENPRARKPKLTRQGRGRQDSCHTRIHLQ